MRNFPLPHVSRVRLKDTKENRSAVAVIWAVDIAQEKCDRGARASLTVACGEPVLFWPKDGCKFQAVIERDGLRSFERQYGVVTLTRGGRLRLSVIEELPDRRWSQALPTELPEMLPKYLREAYRQVKP